MTEPRYDSYIADDVLIIDATIPAEADVRFVGLRLTIEGPHPKRFIAEAFIPHTCDGARSFGEVPVCVVRTGDTCPPTERTGGEEVER